MTNRPYVWQMVREAVVHLGSPTTYTAIRDYIRGKYGDVNENTITCQTIICSVNHPSRIHYSDNKKPRSCDSQYDFLYNTGRGKVELYDPEKHGLWELRLDEYGKIVAAQSDLIVDPIPGNEPDDEGLPFALELHLRDFLEKNINTIRINGTMLRVFVDAEGRDGIEYPTDVGPIDILAHDPNGNFVVLELKVGKGPDRAVGQVLRYMGWVTKHLAKGKKVSGVIVACDIDEKLKYAASLLPAVTLYEYKLRFDLSAVDLD